MFSLSAPNVPMKRMMSVKPERRMAKKRRRDMDEDRSKVPGIIAKERMLLKDEKGFEAKWDMPSNDLKGDIYDFLS